MSSKMRVTHVQAVGPFLRVFGQLDPETHRQIQAAIDTVIALLGQANQLSVPNLAELPVDTICLARFMGKFFRRARVIGHRGVNEVFVQFIDYGNECNVRIQEIRLMNFESAEVHAIQTLPTQATPCILTGIYYQWIIPQINELNVELSGEYVTAVKDATLGMFTFITIIWRKQNLVKYLVDVRKYGNFISIEEQTSTFYAILTKSRGLVPVRQLHSAIPPSPINMGPLSPPIPQPTLAPPIIQTPPVIRMPYKNNRRIDPTAAPTTHLSSPPKRSVLTFKSNTLMVGNFYDVYCCFVENGPCLFSVHLKATTDELNDMMNEIENIPLSNLTERPSIGMACIARYSEDNHLYRAVIMTIKPTSCQVAYVDYGNTENVQFADLYEIPANMLDQKIFAIRFALSSYKDLEPLDDVLKNAFKDMVLHKYLRLKVMPLEGPPLVQYCELYDGNSNILESLKCQKNLKLTYFAPPPLANNDIVVIRYVESPKRFFVQKVDSIRPFDQMMDDLFLHCKKMNTPLHKYTKGSACAVKFENAWYRAEILGMNQNRVHIRHVDFGNERNVDGGQLCAITERLVKFPIQAMKCCLKGFENTSTLSESATVQLEMLAENENNERRHFKCQIYQVQDDGTVLVNLIDDQMRPELNLMKKLYKLSMPFNKYIGLEKEEFPYQQNVPVHKPTTDYIRVSPTFNSTPVTIEEPPVSTAHQLSTDWEVRSSHSPTSVDSKDRSSPSDYQQNNRRLNQSSPQQSRPFMENNNRRDYLEQQPTTTFRGKNGKLPPRFQKQQDETRKMQNNRPNNNAYDQPRYNSNQNYSQNTSSSFHNAQTNNSQPQSSHPVACDDEWETEPQQQQLPAAAKPISTSPFISSHEEYVPLNYAYLRSDVAVPSREEILLCWWISPHQFYTHNCSGVPKFEILMRDIQIFYKNKSVVTNRSIEVGSSIVARYQKDQVLYRATVLAHNEQLRKYRVEFVDFGNQATITANDIWLLEKRFSQFPIMAQLCGFENVVSNFEHREIISQVEKYLKPGLKLFANYQRKENTMYYADIEVSGKSLRELLIQDGSLSSVEPNLSLDMLSGQQIRIQIVSIRDLLNFQIEIEGCNLKLMSSYNDIKFVKSNSHLSNEFKNNYVGKCCVADVIDVSKEKILMLQPIIPLFNSVISQKICDYPVVYREINVKVAFIETENIMYAHPVAVEGKLADMLESMYNFYSTQGSPPRQYSPGTICAALSEDGNWYRAKIIYCDTANHSTEVFYIDYGNIEYIQNKDHIRELDQQFYESSALAIRFYFPIKSERTDSTAVDTIKTLTDGYELTLSVVDRYKGCWICDIQSNGHSLIYVLKDNYSLANGMDIEHAKNIIDNDASRDIPQSPVLPPSKPPTFEIKSTIATPVTTSSPAAIPKSDSGIIVSDRSDDVLPEIPSDMIAGYLSHCDNPGRFFLHLTSKFPELRKLQDNIQIVAGSLPPLMTYVTGALCIALYTVDETWYRAKIIDSEIMAVQFIDYGNTDVLTDNSFVKEMNEAFANVPPFAIACALPISPRNTVDWVDEANNIFNEAYEKTVYFEYITQNPKKNYVNLKIDGLSVADKLIADGLARKLEVLKSGEKGFVSHINSLSDFYIQMESYADGLELIAGHLADFENFKVLSDFSAGNVCAAVFPEDNSWYRAKIISHAGKDTEVLFIDFGNTAITTELREISADIANLPFLSKKCSLRMPDHVLSWSDQAEALFHELSAMGETVFIVELIEPSDHAIIDLYVGERNILEDLEPLCDKRPIIEMDLSSSMGKDDFAIHESVCEPKWEEVVVSFVNSPNDFYIHLDSEKDRLDQMLERLNSEELGHALDRPAVGTICNALYSDDGAYYRAEILSYIESGGCKVLFIDYGNYAVSENLYSLPTGSNTIPPLAHACTLEPNGPLNLTVQSVVDKFNAMINDSESFKVDVINRSVKPWVVSLRCNGSDAYEELEKHQTEIGNVPPCEPVSQVDIEVTVSFINSPTDFYVHLSSESEKLQEMLDHLNSDELGSALVKPAVGTICNALFNDDGAYYRAEVLSNNEDDGCKVLFIDYGNTAISNELFALPAECIKAPALAYNCSLDPSGSLDLTSELIVEKFHEFVNKSEQTKICITNRSAKTWIVSVQCDGEDLYDELKKLKRTTKNDEPMSMAQDIVDDIVENAANESIVIHDLVGNLIDRAVDNAVKQNGHDVSEVTISHANSPADFYIHLPCEKDELDKILEYLNSEQLDETLVKPELGEICCALFRDDGAYYRAEILSNNNEADGYEVLFIDYGNTTVSHELRFLSADLTCRPALAYHCTLDPNGSLNLNSSSVAKKFQKIVDNNEIFVMDIIDSSAKPWVVSIKYNGTDVYEELKKEQTAANNRLDDSDSQALNDLVNEIVDQAMDESSDSIESCQTPVKQIVNDIIEESIRKSTVETQLNFELIKNIVNDAVNKSLDILLKKSQDCDRDEAVKDIVNKVVEQCLDRLVEQKDNTQEKLDETTKFVRDMLESAIDTSISIIREKTELQSGPVDVIVTKVYNTRDFWVRLSADEQKLTAVEDYLKDGPEFEKFLEIQPHELCAALHPTAGIYCRAKTLSLSENGEYNVELIDSGARLTTKEVRKLPSELKNSPPLAKHCALSSRDTISIEPEIFKKYFEANSTRTYQMKVLEQCQDVMIVTLSSNGSGIQEELAALSIVQEAIDASLNDILKDAVVSHTNSPNDFYIQFACDTKNLEGITESLYDAVNFVKISVPRVGMLCAALFPDDGAFYRAKILSILDDNSSYEVLFIDFGNVSVTDDIRILPEDIEKKECIAKHCALENNAEIDLWSENACDFFIGMVQSHLGETFQVEIKSEPRQFPLIVRLCYQSKDIYDDLKKQMADEDSHNSSEIWIQAKDSIGAIISEDIIETLIDTMPLPISNGGGGDAGDSKASIESDHLNDTDTTTTSTSSEMPNNSGFTVEQLAEELWDGLKKLGLQDSNLHERDRASSTSNLCDNKMNSDTALLSEQNDPARSKSVECFIDDKN